jgi:helix-turn-helix protein
MTTANVPTEKALYRVSEARQILSMSRSGIYEVMQSGRLAFVKEGNTRYVTARAIAEYVALLEREAETQRAA